MKGHYIDKALMGADLTALQPAFDAVMDWHAEMLRGLIGPNGGPMLRTSVQTQEEEAEKADAEEADEADAEEADEADEAEKGPLRTSSRKRTHKVFILGEGRVTLPDDDENKNKSALPGRVKLEMLRLIRLKRLRLP
jgi:hypothetical protein